MRLLDGRFPGLEKKVRYHRDKLKEAEEALQVAHRLFPPPAPTEEIISPFKLILSKGKVICVSTKPKRNRTFRPRP